VDHWLKKQIEEVDKKTSPDPLDPVIQIFKDTIESSAELALTMFFNQIFTEVPTDHNTIIPTS